MKLRIADFGLRMEEQKEHYKLQHEDFRIRLRYALCLPTLPAAGRRYAIAGEEIE
jgi:hypothetical protein